MKAWNNRIKIPDLNRKKTDPGEFIFTGKADDEEMDIQLFMYNKTECVEKKNISPSAINTFPRDAYNYWLNIYGLNEPESIASICRKQNIHSLVIQDILDVDQRSKFQEFEGFSFLTIKSIIPSSEGLRTEQISFVFAQNFLISFQEKKADYFEHLRFRLREDKGIIRERGVDYLLYTMLESILDNYFKTLQKLDNDVEELHFLDINKEPSPNALEMIENHKKIVQFIRKAILPVKEFAQIIEREECQFVEKIYLNYFMEIKDLCLTLMDSCDVLLATLESNTNLFFSVQGHKMNQVMKTLTIVATIFIPLTFIAGIYGMNFNNMPELQWKYGYLSVWVLIFLIFLYMLYYFRKKKWF